MRDIYISAHKYIFQYINVTVAFCSTNMYIVEDEIRDAHEKPYALLGASEIPPQNKTDTLFFAIN